MPPTARTRPTSDRVRESAFNLITTWAGTAGEPAVTMLDRFSFLDLYAGSAAVALEAASRGAAPVVAVESDHAALAAARRNVAQLGLPVEVVRGTVEAFLAGRSPIPFDIVWLDPPYRQDNDTLAGVVSTVVGGGWLAEDGLVVAERSARDPDPDWPGVLRRTWSRRYGETTLHFGTLED